MKVYVLLEGESVVGVYAHYSDAHGDGAVYEESRSQPCRVIEFDVPRTTRARRAGHVAEAVGRITKR